MNAKQRRIRYRATMNADPGADTTKTAEGRDYMVSYFLNEYQRGSMVMRFAAPPSDPELYAELRKYGLEASMLKNVSASPVADVKDQGARYAQAQRATEDAQLHTRSLVQQRSPPVWRIIRPLPMPGNTSGIRPGQLIGTTARTRVDASNR